ncbi:mitochondrial 2-enoyl thioester reductase [Kickxella alabastrina]|uniref:Mitochondrial 2-enoyl thioester reductase n=1 Tax=Kickxella alabastrina TaxID=61397 RepID=A0ACC1IMK3_9FUNG|nr:mitochondrial 2-enoyl thioester reductase [Kickxella alabastrina]
MTAFFTRFCSVSVRSTGPAYMRKMSTVRAQAAIYREPGSPQQVLEATELLLSLSPPPTGVLIKMLAAPVNPSDLNQIEGIYPVKGNFSSLPLTTGPAMAAVGGNEGVGKVLALGSNVSGLQIGDWVVPRRSGQFGTWCTHALVDRTHVSAVPSEWHAGLNPLHVGMLKVNPCTAYRMLRDFAELRQGDYVIQNGANSGVGRSVIQLAKPLGVRTINVVRDRPNYDQLESELLTLGADIVVKDKDLAQLKGQINGPVRLGFNCVGGRMTLAMTKLISSGGTLVTYGGMSRQPVTLPTSLLLFKDICARGFWMNRWYLDASHEAKMQDMWRNILRMAREGSFVQQPVKSVQWTGGVSEVHDLIKGAVNWESGDKHAFVFE